VPASESDVAQPPKKNGLVKKLSLNGHLNGNLHTVISRESLYLVPDGDHNSEERQQETPADADDKTDAANTNSDETNQVINLSI